MKAKKSTETLTRTSSYREDRKNFLTESGYSYYRWDEDLKKEVPVHIGLDEEYTDPDGTIRTIDREILILLDSIDHLPRIPGWSKLVSDRARFGSGRYQDSRRQFLLAAEYAEEDSYK